MDESQTPGRTDRRRSLGGILILLGLFGLAVVIISLDEILASRTPMIDVHAELPESGGLVAGAPVWIAGHTVGEVVAVTLRPPEFTGASRVIAIARIPRSHLPLLRGDSRARLAKPRLAGDPVLDLSPGTAAAPPLTAADTIPAVHTPNRAAEMIASARALLVEADTLMDGLRQVAALYRARQPMIEQVTRSVDLATIELDRTAVALRESPLTGALADARLQERFARVRSSLATLQAGLGRYTSGPLGERIASLRVRADSLQADVALLDSLTASPNHGFIGRIRTDSALSVEAGRTTAQMDTLVQEVLSNPFMFW